MFHDPDAFACLSRKMRRPLAARDPLVLPPVADLVRRLEEARIAVPAQDVAPR